MLSVVARAWLTWSGTLTPQNEEFWTQNFQLSKGSWEMIRNNSLGDEIYYITPRLVISSMLTLLISTILPSFLVVLVSNGTWDFLLIIPAFSPFIFLLQMVWIFGNIWVFFSYYGVAALNPLFSVTRTYDLWATMLISRKAFADSNEYILRIFSPLLGW